jgi:hypothetical protein
MAATTTTTVDDFLLAAALREEIAEALREATFLTEFITHEDLAGKNSKVAKLPKGGTVTAAGLTEGTDMGSTAYSDGGASSVTVGEAGVRLDITDVAALTGIAGLDHYVRVATNALRDKMETDLSALFSGFSSSVGTTTVDLTLDLLATAIYTFRAAKGRGMPIVVLHPRQILTIRKLIAGTSGSTATYYGSGTFDPKFQPIAGYVFSWLGVAFFESANVPTANAGADYLGAIFSECALAMATLWDVRVEPQRDASARLTEFNVTACYGVAEFFDACGVGILSKAAL